VVLWAPAAACAAAEDSPTFWLNVVGIDADAVHVSDDRTLFRLLEWNGRSQTSMSRFGESEVIQAIVE